MYQKLNCLWRISMTGVAFALFGMGGLILSMIIFPLHHLIERDHQRRKCFAQKAIGRTFRAFLWWLKTFRVFQYRFEGFETLNEDQNVIVVANHPSILDYVFLASRIDHCSCIVKKKLLENIFMKGVIGAADYIPNDETEGFIALCEEKLSPQDKLLIFPEGTRTTAGAPLRLQRGAANIALRTQKDIRLVSIDLDQPMLTKELKWYQVPPLQPTFIIKVQEKINICTYLNSEHRLSYQSRQLTDDLTQRLQHNLQQSKKDTA